MMKQTKGKIAADGVGDDQEKSEADAPYFSSETQQWCAEMFGYVT